MLSDPGGAAPVCPYVTSAMVPSGFSTPSATPQVRNNGAQSLQPYGLRPAPSLSTLSPRRYRRGPKTRYGMRWVGTFPVALAATSSGALRGALKTCDKTGLLPQLLGEWRCGVH